MMFVFYFIPQRWLTDFSPAMTVIISKSDFRHISKIISAAITGLNWYC